MQHHYMEFEAHIVNVGTGPQAASAILSIISC